MLRIGPVAIGLVIVLAGYGYAAEYQPKGNGWHSVTGEPVSLEQAAIHHTQRAAKYPTRAARSAPPIADEVRELARGLQQTLI